MSDFLFLWTIFLPKIIKNLIKLLSINFFSFVFPLYLKNLLKRFRVCLIQYARIIKSNFYKRSASRTVKFTIHRVSREDSTYATTFVLFNIYKFFFSNYYYIGIINTNYLTTYLIIIAQASSKYYKKILNRTKVIAFVKSS